MPTTNLFYYAMTKLEPSRDPQLATTKAVLIAPSQNLAAGTILGELTGSPGVFKAYDHTQNDGTQVPKGILMYAVTTDANGIPTNIGGPSFPYSDPSVPMYDRGTFNCADIWSSTELAQALSVAGWGALIFGTASAGEFRMG